MRNVIDELGAYQSIEFPLIHTLNIKAEKSTVTLRVPQSHQWFRFGGGTRF